ncbi:hypothetical protein L0F63_005734, partial [Massospora cicadina]
ALNELVRLAKEKFLDGRDETFDYSIVDHNDAYDNILIDEQEMENNYFDSDEPDQPDPDGT